ncbi:HNH endonuclease [Methylobacterium fujisawaense]|uniref:HNH endonuclease n=1 Tax=Methylobacterium fujisawaense TaxID=107400 RepID=UPI003D064FAD
MIHGYDAVTIDHVNGNRADNRDLNLRDATRQQNCWNVAGRGRSGIKGVRQTAYGTFQARLGHRHLGNFASAEEARSAYLAVAVAERGAFEGAAR